jgi:hypothetical protein
MKATNKQSIVPTVTPTVVSECGQQLLTFGDNKDQDYLLGMAIFNGVCPFSLFESANIQEFVKSLCPSYYIPGYLKISTSILDICYIRIKQ